jgi:Astacin (Peptidase family M12A)
MIRNGIAIQELGRRLGKGQSFRSFVVLRVLCNYRQGNCAMNKKRSIVHFAIGLLPHHVGQLWSLISREHWSLYLCVSVASLSGLQTSVHAATFGKSMVQAAPPLSPDEVRKKYRTKTAHKLEVVAIDDMLFRVQDFSVRAGLSGTPWPNGDFVFLFDGSVTPQQQTSFLSACAMWSVGAHVTCKPRTSEPTYYFTVYSTLGSSECVNQSLVGMQANGFLDVCSWGIPAKIAHEIGHAFGLIHEQSRPDRAAYVFINFPNVQFGQEHNFDIVQDAQVVGEYDYASIMEYYPCDFSINASCQVIPNDPNEAGEKKTIVPVMCGSSEESVMGRAVAPSQLDLEGMAQRYGPPVALAVFKKARNAICQTQILNVQDKVRICDKNNENCGIKASSVLYSQTERFLRRFI